MNPPPYNNAATGALGMWARMRAAVRSSKRNTEVAVFINGEPAQDYRMPSEDEVYKASIRNFCCLPLPLRERAVQHLRRRLLGMKGGPEAIEVWTQQAARNEHIGHDEWPYFHFNRGMVIRNILREVVPDEELTPMKQPGGELSSNWDDYYLGALESLVYPATEVQTELDAYVPKSIFFWDALPDVGEPASVTYGGAEKLAQPQRVVRPQHRSVLMWFLFGLMLGASIADGPSAGLPGMGSIPMRCYAALEENANAYKRCRYPSLMGELASTSTIWPGNPGLCGSIWLRRGIDYPNGAAGWKERCDIEWHLDLEVKALTALNAEAQRRAKEGK